MTIAAILARKRIIELPIESAAPVAYLGSAKNAAETPLRAV